MVQDMSAVCAENVEGCAVRVPHSHGTAAPGAKAPAEITLDTIREAMADVGAVSTEVRVYAAAATASRFCPEGTVVLVTPCACPWREQQQPNHLARHVAILLASDLLPGAEGAA